jgi:hypothetical protein
MPQATEELRNFVRNTFGSLDCGLVIKELEARGFQGTEDWCWRRIKQPTEFEWNCIDFLIQEWDFGGYIED